MHIAEGVLPARDALLWWAVATPALLWGWPRAADRSAEQDLDRRSLEGMAVGLLFAMTLLPIPVPVAGATSHICATPVLALLLGLRRIILPTALVLFVQALFFAHGGLTTLGANIVTLGVFAPAVAVLVARALTWLGAPAFSAIVGACFLGDVAVYAGDSIILATALAGAESFATWLVLIGLGFAPVQLPLAALEGFLSGFLVRGLAERRSSVVPAWLDSARLRGGAALVPGRALVLACVVPPIAALLAGSPARAEEERYRGLDDVVIARAAEKAGREARPVLDLGDGEVPLFVFSLGSFVAGILVGRGWSRLEAPRAR